MSAALSTLPSARWRVSAARARARAVTAVWSSTPPTPTLWLRAQMHVPADPAAAVTATAMTGSPSILAGICSSAQRPCSFFSTAPPSFFSYSICMDKFSFAIGIFLSFVHPLPVRFRNFFVFFTCPLCPLCLSSVHPFSYCIHYILLATDCQFRHKKALRKGGLTQSKSGFRLNYFRFAFRTSAIFVIPSTILSSGMQE